MTPEREHDLERLDEETNRADTLTEERDCARETLREAEQTIVGLRASMHLIADRLRKTQPIVDFLNANHAPTEVGAAWKDLVYTSGIRAGMAAECDPREWYVEKAKLKPILTALEMLDMLSTEGTVPAHYVSVALKLAREQLWVPAPETEPPGSVFTPQARLEGGPGHQNTSCGHGDPKKGHS